MDAKFDRSYSDKPIALRSVLVCGESMNPQFPNGSPLFRVRDIGYILSLEGEPWKYRILTHHTYTKEWECGTVHELYDEKNGRLLGIFRVVGWIRFYTMETYGYVPSKKLPHYRDRRDYDGKL